MIPKSIALIADYGFDPTQNYSHKQMLWLKYISYKNNTVFITWRKKLNPILLMVIAKRLTPFMNFKVAWIFYAWMLRMF